MQTTTKPFENAEEILQSLRQLLSKELSAVSTLIKKELHASVPIAQEITQHIFKSGGKQLRPLLLVLTAKACDASAELQASHFELATVIEFVHTATLLHDDVIDNSGMRRGKKTANAIWSNQASVLVGDFLYSRAFQLLARQHNPHIMTTLAKTTNAIAEGELRQLMNQRNPDLTEKDYFQVVTEKTAKLFSASAQIGAILSNASKETQQAAATYGLHVGIAFQVIDDLLDYTATTAAIGKNLGDDLADSKTTLPMIYAIAASNEKQAQYLRETIQTGNLSELKNVVRALQETNALKKTREKAIFHTQQATLALTYFPNSAYRQAMQDLLLFAVERGY